MRSGYSTRVMRWTSIRIDSGENPRLLPPSVSVPTSVLCGSKKSSFASSFTTPRNVVSPSRRMPCDQVSLPPSKTNARTPIRRLSEPRRMPSAVGHDGKSWVSQPGNSISRRTRRLPVALSSPSCRLGSDPLVIVMSTL